MFAVFLVVALVIVCVVRGADETPHRNETVLFRPENECPRDQQMQCVAEMTGCFTPCYKGYEDGNWEPCMECVVVFLEKCCDCLLGDYVDCEVSMKNPAFRERFGKIAAEAARRQRPDSPHWWENIDYILLF